MGLERRWRVIQTRVVTERRQTMSDVWYSGLKLTAHGTSLEVLDNVEGDVLISNTTLKGSEYRMLWWLSINRNCQAVSVSLFVS